MIREGRALGSVRNCKRGALSEEEACLTFKLKAEEAGGGGQCLKALEGEVMEVGDGRERRRKTTGSWEEWGKARWPEPCKQGPADQGSEKPLKVESKLIPIFRRSLRLLCREWMERARVQSGSQVRQWAVGQGDEMGA